MTLCKTIVFLVFGYVLVTEVHADVEYFSSMTGMDDLLQSEIMLMLGLKRYIALARQHIDSIESELKRIEDEHLLANNNKENYLTNPVNVYRLMKRLHTDWSAYETRIKQNHAGQYFFDRVVKIKQHWNFPQQEDVDGAVIALVRLQDTYKLNVTHLSAGILNGVKYGKEMSWHDCYVFGEHLYNIGFYNHSKQWFKESMLLLASEHYNKESFALEFMENVAERLVALGDTKEAYRLSKQVLAIDSNRQRAWDLEYKLVTLKLEDFDVANDAVVDDSYHKTNEFKIYEKLCRGELLPTPAQLRPLRCRYIDNGLPSRLIAPFKAEELNIDPPVLMLHDVISDNKMSMLKQMAVPHMQRSTVATNNVNVSATSHIRVSKQAWLPYHTHSYLQYMLRQVHDATGLDMTYAEQLQVANYGLGGHYEPHWDFYFQLPDNEGNRIATAMFYFSHVEQGGATAFPFLRIAVKPVKGSALLWYNLHRSADLDYRTKHAACPVLKGSKWIANIWVRELTQTFARPCALQRDNRLSLQYKEIK